MTHILQYFAWGEGCLDEVYRYEYDVPVYLLFGTQMKRVDRWVCWKNISEFSYHSSSYVKLQTCV